MKDMQDIAGKRWFMGKGVKIKSIREEARACIAGNALTIVRVTFAASEKRAPDLYALIENESGIGEILHEAFSASRRAYPAKKNSIPAQNGRFTFVRAQGFPARLPAKAIRSIAPLDAEQSNSAFASERLFFKLYRRLQPGTHPEVEILERLSGAKFTSTPKLYGTCYYTDATGRRYALGILEKLCPGGTDAWKFFNCTMAPECARALGRATARMHRAMAKMPGTPTRAEEIPFDKLETLLRGFVPAQKSTKKIADKVIAALPRLKEIAQAGGASALPEGEMFRPQRIHGDYHLGQVLVFDNEGARAKNAPTFKILDFEGEPTRSLDYRRALRSPLVDIAGMLRSFQYASAVSGLDSTACEQAFIGGYARAARMKAADIERAVTPYTIAKAVYEACYELEFRPDWFHIPARALLEAIR